MERQLRGAAHRGQWSGGAGRVFLPKELGLLRIELPLSQRS
jgi:hypothetical protein